MRLRETDRKRGYGARRQMTTLLVAIITRLNRRLNLRFACDGIIFTTETASARERGMNWKRISSLLVAARDISGAFYHPPCQYVDY